MSALSFCWGGLRGALLGGQLPASLQSPLPLQMLLSVHCARTPGLRMLGLHRESRGQTPVPEMIKKKEGHRPLTLTGSIPKQHIGGSLCTPSPAPQGLVPTVCTLLWVP